MRHEIVRNRLESYRAMEVEIRQVEEEIASLEARVYDIQGAMLREEPRGRKKGDGMDLLMKLMVMKDVYTQKWDELIDMRMYIEEAIDALKPLERQMMRARYIDGMTWDRISGMLSYSRRHVSTLHDQALAHVGRYLAGGGKR